MRDVIRGLLAKSLETEALTDIGEPHSERG